MIAATAKLNSEQAHTLAARLLSALDEAHRGSARRANVSSNALVCAAAAGVPFTSALVAALATLGGLHGPLTATQLLLEADEPEDLAREMLARGQKVPGWGNSFVKGHGDPAWEPVRELLSEGWGELTDKMDRVTAVLHGEKKYIFPNPSAYTAACAIVLGIRAEACAYLFVRGRLAAWADLYLDSLKGA